MLLIALVAIAFLPGFDGLGASEFGAYLTAVLASAVGTILALGTWIDRLRRRVGYGRRTVTRQRNVHVSWLTASMIFAVDLALYGVALAASVLLVLDAVLDGPVVGVLAACFATAIVALWVVLPLQAARDIDDAKPTGSD